MTDLPPKQRRFYVYALVDPRDGEIFYVGKGSGRRAYAHEAAVRRGCEKNGFKAERIAAIIAAGQSVQVQFVATALEEREAFRQERRLIASMAGRLTNVTSGTTTALDRSQATARALLILSKPFDQWASERNPTPREVELFHGVIAGLEKIARDGRASTICARSAR